MAETFLVEKTGHVLYGIFNRPEARNALSQEMLTSFREFLHSAEQDETVRCVVLRGVGKHFVSGGDVKGFGETLHMSADKRSGVFEKRVLASFDLFRFLHNFKKPVVTITKGACAGAGVAIVMASDFVIAGGSSFYMLGHIHLGISLDVGISHYLPRLVGLRRAKQIAFLGERISAEQALRYGLINEVHPDKSVEKAAEILTDKLTNMPTNALAEMKTLLNESFETSFEAQYQKEAASVGRCAAKDNFTEGVSAFIEKRRPNFNRT